MALDSIEKKQTTKIYLLDGTFKKISYDSSTTVADAIKDMAQKIELGSYAGFGLFECSRISRAKKDEFFGLKDNELIQEIVEEFDSKDRKCRLLMKRKHFYETDEAITEEVFGKLLYLQFSHDFLEGFYPFDLNDLDLAKLSALLLLANIGSIDPDPNKKGFWYKNYVEKYRPTYLLRTTYDEKDCLSAEITECYRSMKDIMDKEAAKRMFVNTLRKLPYGNSVFFIVDWIVFPYVCENLHVNDRIVLAINNLGVHFIRRDRCKCLLSVGLKDIKQYGSLGNKLEFNIRVEDTMKEFAFETKQADEIIVALESHIQHQMNLRGTKTQIQAEEKNGGYNKKEKNPDSLEGKEADVKVKELTCELSRCREVIRSYVALSNEWVKKFSALEETCSSLKAAEKQKLAEYEIQKAELQRLLLVSEESRRKLQNTVLDLKGKIRVFIRVRPSLQTDDCPAVVSYPAESAGRGINLINSGTTHQFSFDKVFAPDESQQEVFMEISELVQSSIDGGKVSILAYGQTGAGKTYTMVGTQEDPVGKGLIPRSLEQAFQRIQDLAAQGWKYQMKASALEIYNEKVIDLLASPRIGLKIRSLGEQFFVENITEKDVCSKEDALKLLKAATCNRSVASTKMNEESSRSHFMFTLRIFGQNERTRQVQGVLNFTDLAGSERLHKSLASGDTQDETGCINKSLSAFSNVILALQNKKEGDHVPYRDSELTKVLKTCFDGSGKIVIFVNVSEDPCSSGESLQSLRFAKRTRTVRTKTIY